LCFSAISTILLTFTTPEAQLDREDGSKSSEHVYVQQQQHVAIGGWRVADNQTREELDIGHCDIERHDAGSVSLEEFESTFRFKKPVLITFPNGAADWTNPNLFQRHHLTELYSYWSVSSGRSLDIVKFGGSGRYESSFSEYLEEMMDDRRDGDVSSEPTYIFDRNFFQDSTELTGSLRTPPFFRIAKGMDESFFFLGASKSGVSFHKHADAWNAVLFGRKRWFLYPPTKTPPGGVWPGFSQLDWLKLIYPTLKEKDKPIECVQEAGEILYLPESYYHGTINIGETLAIGFQKNVAQTPVEQIFYALRPLEYRAEHTEDEEEKDVLYKQIVEEYYKLLELLPANAEVCHKLGEALYNDEQYDQALEFTQRAIDFDPKFVVAYCSMSRYLRENNDLNNSESVIKTAYALNPQNLDVLTLYAEVANKKEDFETALQLYQQATHLDPDHPLLYFRISFILQSMGRNDEALLMNQKAQLLEEEQIAMNRKH
jgi:tetratricopeptide (TPR) repeat protein